jgi:FtsH-binding integral membrane protein
MGLLDFESKKLSRGLTAGLIVCVVAVALKRWGGFDPQEIAAALGAFGQIGFGAMIAYGLGTASHNMYKAVEKKKNGS